MANRSAKDGARSSRHYGGEGALTHPSYQGVCGRYGRSGRDPRRARIVPGWPRDNGPYKPRDEVGKDAMRVVERLHSTQLLDPIPEEVDEDG